MKFEVDKIDALINAIDQLVLLDLCIPELKMEETFQQLMLAELCFEQDVSLNNIAFSEYPSFTKMFQ